MMIIIRSIMKNCSHFFRHPVPLFSPCIMRMISNFTIFFVLSMFIFKFFCEEFLCDFCCCFVNEFIFSFLKLIIPIESQNFLGHSLPLHRSCLFSMLLNDGTVDIEKPDGISSPTLVWDNF